jgi:hypothetical protein
MNRIAGACGLAALLLYSSGASAADPPARPQNQCFRSEDYQSFRPIDEHAFYIRVNVNDYYRIDVEGRCPELTQPQAFLITQVRGSDEICGPLDWDLKIGEPGPGGFSVPCIVKSQTRLTPAEAAAIPKKLKP